MRLPVGKRQRLRIGLRMVNLIPNHGFDGREKIVGSEIAVFDLAELVFPLSGQQRGTERFGQNGNQISAFVGRQKLFDLFRPCAQ